MDREPMDHGPCGMHIILMLHRPGLGGANVKNLQMHRLCTTIGFPKKACNLCESLTRSQRCQQPCLEVVIDLDNRFRRTHFNLPPAQLQGSTSGPKYLSFEYFRPDLLNLHTHIYIYIHAVVSMANN
eukprot:TRINITY_DN2012_c0_g2_i1.p1 TRINITY_DN2012_c0_g2~~TRINITY_DN2012_c0_g2_i1.p1  ORF type:complete len:127 (+),score=1.34 TRINITY_DN2012_c0_g2_i1:498-878(+)